MESLRASASCIGVTGSFSVARDYLGFARGVLPADPAGVTTTVSLKKQIDLLKDDHFHVNVIKVGSDLFSDSDHEEVDYGIYKLRNIYDNVSIGVGRVLQLGIAQTDARGFDDITSDDEVTDVTNTWYVDNDGIDLFIPFTLNVPSGSGSLLGRSPRPGPCEDKDDKGMNGAVTGVWGDEQTARTLAHELGHYLGLKHRNGSPTNLMAQSSVASSTRNSVVLTSSQGNSADDHCLVDDGC